MPYPAARPFVAPAGDGVLVSGRSILRGWCVRETAGAVATLNLWDNSTDDAGQLAVTFNLPAAGSSIEFPRTGGIVFEQGIWVDRQAGDLDVILYVSPETSMDSYTSVFDDIAEDVNIRRLALRALGVEV